MNAIITAPYIDDKVDRKREAVEALLEKQKEQQEAKPTTTKVSGKDSYDSTPAVENYNNYSPNGLLHESMYAQQTSYTETPSATDIVATTDAVTENVSAALDEPLSEIDRLVQSLKANEEFMRASNDRGVWHNSLYKFDEWRELGLHLIKGLSSEDYELLQKMLWTSIAEVHQIHRDNRHLADMPTLLPLKSSHRQYDLISIWNNMGASINTTAGVMGEALRGTVTRFFNFKMRTEGLSDVERVFLPHIAQMEERFGPDATFGNRMSSVADYVNMRFSEAQQQLRSGERFTFNFNSNFSFNVSGGTGNNAEFLQGVFNNAGGWLLSHIIDVLFLHRGENGEVPPWLATDHEHDIWRIVAVDRGVGFIQASEKFLEELEKIRSAYARKLTEQWLQEQFGFGLDDLIYEDGVLSGRTQEIDNVVRSDRRFEALLYESRTKLCASIYDALNTPRQQDLSFINIIFENGMFSIEHR